MNTSRRDCLSLVSTFAVGTSVASAVPARAASTAGGSRLNVKHFGARGNRNDDDSAAFQAAVDALPVHGGTIVIPASDTPYLIGGIECGSKGVEWVGEGGPGQSAALGHAATELLVKDGTVGIAFGDGTNSQFRGSTLSNLRLLAQSPAARGGLLFRAISNATAHSVVCSNFSGPGCFGWKFDGSSGAGRYPSATMYNDLYGCGANNCTVGIYGKRATGLRVFGGLLDANDNHASAVVPGTIGLLWQAPGDTLGVFGTRFQSYEIHIDSRCPGTYISGTRHESFNTAIRINGDFCTVMPGNIDNSLLGGGGTAVYLQSGKQAFVLGNSITAVGTRINKGAATNYVIIDGQFESG